MTRFPHIERFALALLLAAVVVPVSALAFIKPLRVVTPGIVHGVHCGADGICTDDRTRLAEAQRLYAGAAADVSRKIGPFHSHTRIVFCSTDACAAGFGLGPRAAFSIADQGIAVAPRGWKPFYVAHELIHRREADEWGYVSFFSKPRWLIEGMAYALSDDPRHPLTEPFEAWRAQFKSWSASIHENSLWTEGRKIR